MAEMAEEVGATLTWRSVGTGSVKGFASIAFAYNMFEKFIAIGVEGSTTASLWLPLLPAFFIGACFMQAEASLFSSVDHERENSQVPDHEARPDTAYDRAKQAIVVIYALGQGLNYSFGMKELIKIMRDLAGYALSEMNEFAIAGTCFAVCIPFMVHVYRTYSYKLHKMTEGGDNRLTFKAVRTGGIKGLASDGFAFDMLRTFMEIGRDHSTPASIGLPMTMAAIIGFCFTLAEAAMFSSVDHEQPVDSDSESTGSYCTSAISQCFSRGPGR
jgi:hypothetical protein